MVRNTLRNKKTGLCGENYQTGGRVPNIPTTFFFNLHQRVPERCGGFNKGVRSDFFFWRADSSLVDKPSNQPVHGGLTTFGKVSIPIYSNQFQSIPWYPGSIAIRKLFANIRKVFTIGTIRGHLFAQNCPIVKKTVQINCPTFINLTFITP